MNVGEIIIRLEREYGPRQWQPGNDAISTLVETILSQNTSDVNSHRAFESIRTAFPDWAVVAEATVEDIAESIKSGGLAMIKARRIKSTLQQILMENGDLDLAFLGQLPLSEAKAWLKQLPGVGPKTAGCVLLFALGQPALPVDTHVFRVARRLGLIDRKVSPDRAHEVLEGIVSAGRIYQFHLHMIDHGRRVCHARHPSCQHCVLSDICPSISLVREVSR